MDASIEGFVLQLETVRQDLPGLARQLSFEQFNWRPDAGRWSIGQCVAHLNITLERYLPVLEQTAADGRRQGRLASGPFVASMFERWFFTSLEPPPGRRARTPQAFVGGTALTVAAELERWQALHLRLAESMRAADGLDLRRLKVRSQFAPVSFSLGATFSVLLAHERRHIWQAREVRKHPGFPSA